MTHATYAFLIPIDDPDADDETLAKEAERLFEHRFDDRLNENNWNHQECLVLCNGRVVNINPEDDALFREAEQLPQEARYQWARLTALRCVANKLEFGVDPSRPSAMKAHWDDFDSLMTQIMLEVPPRLAALWAKGPMLLTTDSPADNWLDRSCRDVWGRQMELLLRSMERHKPPFSRDGSPYECCAFDLSRGSDNKEHDAILFVDIHTLSVALAPAPGARSTAGGGTQSGLRLGVPASKSPRNADHARQQRDTPTQTPHRTSTP